MLNSETIRLLREYPMLRATSQSLQAQIDYKKDAGADPTELETLKQQLRQAGYILTQLNIGLSILTDEERLILDKMYIHPAKGMTLALCDALEVEMSTLYRRRDKALAKLSQAIPGDHAPPMPSPGPRCSALPVADAAEHKRVPRSVGNAVDLSTRRPPGTANG